jgi:poly-gamma-glutamate synthesis protein (capsule biosynthesis protein)
MNNRNIKAVGGIAFTAFCILLVSMLIFMSGCGDKADPSGGEADKLPKSANTALYDEPAGPPASWPVTLDIACAGDIMMHGPQITAAARDDGYDFSEYFKYVQPFIEEEDLALCNLEETFGGKPYGGYPMFSAPDELIGFVKDAGFDVGFTANNHMLDSGQKGLIRTAEQIRKSGLLQTGSVIKPEEDDWIVTEVKGVKIGIVAYTYESGELGGQRSINGIAMSDETHELINSYDISQFEEDSREIQRSIEGAKADGADLIICYFHWGNEYQRAPDDKQRKVADFAVACGANVIFASHPHVLQPYEFLQGPDGDNVPVFWSMGNFISNQRTETTGKYTEQGMVARVSIDYDMITHEETRVDMDAIPTWVDKYSSGGRNIHTVIPLVGDLSDQPALQASGHLSRAKDALKDIEDLIENTQ